MSRLAPRPQASTAELQGSTAQPDAANGVSALRLLRPPAATGMADQQLLRVDARLALALADLEELWQEAQGDADDALLGGFDLPALLRQVLAAGGKRIRPTMAALGWSACGGRSGTPGEDHLAAIGAALELLHAFALIHDDVMDGSARRRGRPTIHVLAGSLHRAADGHGDAERFGESIAILLGDLAQSEADQLIGDLPGPLRRRWRQLTVELVCGQRADLTGSAVAAPDPSQAGRVARLKSGRYTVRRPLELGAVAAGADPDSLGRLSRYGDELGTAFALRDDLLGVWGDPRVTGKPAGDDLLSGKPTMIIALAGRRLGGRDRALLDRVGTPELGADDVAALQLLLDERGIRAEVEQLIKDHADRALQALDCDTLAAPAVRELGRMAQLIAWRDR